MKALGFGKGFLTQAHTHPAGGKNSNWEIRLQSKNAKPDLPADL